MAEIGIFEITLLRSLAVGVLAVLAALPLRSLLADGRLAFRRAAWILLLAPYLTPVLLIGYAYASFSLSLIHHPNLNILFYSALLWWKFTPVAAVILHFTPAPVSAEAIHCNQLLTAQSSRGIVSKITDWKFQICAGCAGGPIAAFAIVFLFAFSEFEMASLMVVKSWTVSLFDAHAGGLALNESLRRVLVPMLFEAAAIGLAFFVSGRRKIIPAHKMRKSRLNWMGWVYLVIAFSFVFALPVVMILWGTIRGIGLLVENFVLTREILVSLLFAAGGSLFAGFLIFGLRKSGNSTLFKAILIAGTLVGLLGSLVLSLAVLAAVQLPGLISIRDTPLPVMFTLGLLLLPLAMVLKRVLELTRSQSALHMVTLMEKTPASGEIIWRLSTGGKFWAMTLLFVWAYWDLTTSSILAPVGMTPVTVRLYNLMHYGQIATLSAMTCAAFAAPILIFLAAFGIRRWWAPR